MKSIHYDENRQIVPKQTIFQDDFTSISFFTFKLGEAFLFVSRRFASRIHEISDLKKALVLSLRAGYTRLRDKKKTY